MAFLTGFLGFGASCYAASFVDSVNELKETTERLSLLQEEKPSASLNLRKKEIKALQLDLLHQVHANALFSMVYASRAIATPILYATGKACAFTMGGLGGGTALLGTLFEAANLCIKGRGHYKIGKKLRSVSKIDSSQFSENQKFLLDLHQAALKSKRRDSRWGLGIGASNLGGFSFFLTGAVITILVAAGAASCAVAGAATYGVGWGLFGIALAGTATYLTLKHRAKLLAGTKLLVAKGIKKLSKDKELWKYRENNARKELDLARYKTKVSKLDSAQLQQMKELIQNPQRLIKDLQTIGITAFESEFSEKLSLEKKLNNLITLLQQSH